MAPPANSADRYEIALTTSLQAALPDIGNACVDVIKNNLATYNEDTGRLQASISWATDSIKANPPSPAQEGDGVSSPKDKLTLNVGTGCSYGQYVEFGSGPHKSASEVASAGETFWDRIRDWAARHGIDEKGAYAIMQSIKRRGTPMHPFMIPSIPSMKHAAGMVLALALRSAMNKVPMVTRTVELSISDTGVQVRRKVK